MVRPGNKSLLRALALLALWLALFIAVCVTSPSDLTFQINDVFFSVFSIVVFALSTLGVVLLTMHAIVMRRTAVHVEDQLGVDEKAGDDHFRGDMSEDPDPLESGHNENTDEEADVEEQRERTSGDEAENRETHPQPAHEAVRNRTHYLDNLKVVLISMVIFGHCSQASGATGDMVWCPQLAFTYTHSLTIASFFIAIPLISTLMNLFFFISGIFVPGSLRRRGTSKFLASKLKRYMFPTFLVYVGLGPFTEWLAFLAVGMEYQQYQFVILVCWFLVYLSLFNLAYALIFHNIGVERNVSDGNSICMGDKLCRWWSRNFLFDSTLYLWILGIGCLSAFSVTAFGGYGTRYFLARGLFPGDGFPYYIVYFFAGTYAKEAGWIAFLEVRAQIPETPSDPTPSEVSETDSAAAETPAVQVRAEKVICCARYTSPVFVLFAYGLLAYLMMVLEKDFDQYTLVENLAVECLVAVMALGIIIVILDLCSRKFNFYNNFLLFLIQSAYAAFIIHPPVLVSVVWVWIYILRNEFGIDITFKGLHSSTWMSDGLIWLGFLFINVLTQVAVWPLAFLVRKLPLLNQIL